MSLLDAYEPVATRILPVILLLDASTSMREDDKIAVLNDSVTEMVEALTDVDAGHGAITVTVISIAMYEASIVHRNVPVGELEFTDLKANGKTPIGGALKLTRELLEDHEAIPSRSFLPTIALVSDGIPTDAWEEELTALLASERGGKATRFALSIGADADHEVLARFTGGEVHEASEASEIKKFLQFITTTVTQATLSVLIPDEPDQIAADSDTAQSILRAQSDDEF